MLLSGFQRNVVHKMYHTLNLIRGKIPCQGPVLLFSVSLAPYFYGDIRTFSFAGIEVVKKTHSLFSLVGKHQLEIRKSCSWIERGLFHHHGTFNSVVGLVPPCGGMEGQDDQKS